MLIVLEGRSSQGHRKDGHVRIRPDDDRLRPDVGIPGLDEVENEDGDERRCRKRDQAR